MEDKAAAEELVGEMIHEKFPEFKGAVNMGVTIEIKRIADVSFKFKKGALILSMETNLHPGDIARLLNLDRQGVPLHGAIISDQAELDLRFNTIDTTTGEIIPDRSLLATVGAEEE
jgi:hypothetical protein